MRMLSTGHVKVAILTTKPANIAAPTVLELNGGIANAADFIPKSLWKWGAGDPKTVSDPALSANFEAEVPTEDTYDLGLGVYRGYTAAGAVDATEDALFAATKLRGTTLYIYARKTGKLSTDIWAAADEIYLGGAVVTGTPKEVSEGWIKYEVPIFAQTMFNFIAAAA
ncbi:MAG TPA: hypothetical protein VFJ94_10780 [Intrasporangium sp.]|uniref:phage tail tube protein n=1 Tax=Intrasporangium sp. TaxID=1925024 RepID=UPI002D766F4C|nr:hypothetical protein [Intrasporangium sp.]HET7398995.1 hypothetical protein [Intrasporangium sp.]